MRDLFCLPIKTPAWTARVKAIRRFPVLRNAALAGRSSEATEGDCGMNTLAEPVLERWNETEPPKDGRPVVLCGRIIVRDELSTEKIPFCQLVYWDAVMGDWLFWETGLCLRDGPEQEVIAQYWMPYPQATSRGTLLLTTNKPPASASGS